MKRHQRIRVGFTLIELMIVLVILVMLFAIAGPRLLGTQKKADIKSTKAQLGNLEASLKLYAVDMRTFPSTEDGLAALIKPPADEAKARKWDGPYLDDEVIPADAWGNAFVYEYPPTQGGRDFPNISSPGLDGEPDTEDDIVNWRATEDGEDGEMGTMDSGDSFDTGDSMSTDMSFDTGDAL
ncbi:MULTISPECIES: type II secretion system major pseudopilin GspG [Crateriforma]|uniref:Type II secretion system core protein G n=1 Tax=Crateriforma conspicua TaxID=2527996 RepID=A0A5C6FTI8_9PLAN|nr:MULTISPECIES: type II secretion system major pseudopilin GspG [Crateriforma]TWU65636.1 Type II secretion system protein G precursor [Crateriforma conspicua]